MIRFFSGIQPSGNLTLGNYLGAIRNWGLLQREKSYECIFCVVDQHAITIPQDPAELRRATREVAAGMIAGGVDPDDCILFNQSYVPEHAMLARSEEHTSELQSLMRISYAVFCLKKKNKLNVYTKYTVKHIKTR